MVDYLLEELGETLFFTLFLLLILSSLLVLGKLSAVICLSIDKRAVKRNAVTVTGKCLMLTLKGVVSHRVLHVGNQFEQFDLKFLQFRMTSQLLLLQLDLGNVLLILLDILDLYLAEQVTRA